MTLENAFVIKGYFVAHRPPKSILDALDSVIVALRGRNTDCVKSAQKPDSEIGVSHHLSDIDKKIIDLRGQGLMGWEIAQQTGLDTPTDVHARVSRLRKNGVLPKNGVPSSAKPDATLAESYRSSPKPAPLNKGIPVAEADAVLAALNSHETLASIARRYNVLEATVISFASWARKQKAAPPIAAKAEQPEETSTASDPGYAWDFSDQNLSVRD